MVRGIAKPGIAGRLGVGRRQIGSKTPEMVQQPYTFPPGSYTFTPPKPGFWKFVMWAAGGSGSGSAGGSSGYAEYTRYLRANDSVALNVCAVQAPSNTTAAFADGRLVTVTFGSAATAGAASGGDVNFPGNPGGAGTGADGLVGLGSGGGAGGTGDGVSVNGGAGAPANLPYRGGRGGNFSGAGFGGSPGAGSTATGGSSSGGAGLIIVALVRE